LSYITAPSTRSRRFRGLKSPYGSYREGFTGMVGVWLLSICVKVRYLLLSPVGNSASMLAGDCRDGAIPSHSARMNDMAAFAQL
jgi:hypothetical protein